MTNLTHVRKHVRSAKVPRMPKRTVEQVTYEGMRVQPGVDMSEEAIWSFKYPDGALAEVTYVGPGSEGGNTWHVDVEGVNYYTGNLKGLLKEYPEFRKTIVNKK